MIEIIEGRIKNNFPAEYAYCKSWNPVTKFILPITRYLRAVNAEKYIDKTIERILDIGCGDGYFLKRSKAREKYGFDELLGDKFVSLAEFPDGYFDCITMLAVIEHFTDHDVVLTHLWPILKPGGLLIITTPKKISENIVRLYAPEIEDDHETYFDKKSLTDLIGKGFELQGHHTFELGLNQVFCYSRLEKMLDS